MGYAKTLEIEPSFAISADVLHSNDAEKAVTGGTYAKRKEIELIKTPYPIGSLRISFAVYNLGATDVKCKIYRNGVAIGTERTSVNDVWTTYEEDFDFTDLSTEDTFELWGYNTAGGILGKVREFRLLGIETGFVNTMV